FLRVGNFRVKLNAEKALVPLQGHRDAVEIPARHATALWQETDRVGMAHPDLRMALQARKDPRLAFFHEQGGRAILPRIARCDFAPELAVEELHAVAYPEHRHSQALQIFEIDVR